MFGPRPHVGRRREPGNDVEVGTRSNNDRGDKKPRLILAFGEPNTANPRQTNANVAEAAPLWASRWYRGAELRKADQLCARRDAQLHEHIPEVIVDGASAEE